jgi:uncharacterized SAM-binding protein YcdF (DUF218 family)
MKRYFFASAIGILLAASLWLMGLIWFVTLMPTQNHLQVTVPTDAIAVWTGGAGRAEKGLELLTKKQGRYLFISGANEKSDKTEIFSGFRRRNPATWNQLQSRISLGKMAKDTRGNAVETANWVKRNKFRSLRLVTANYHMPRSLIEMQRIMPSLLIIPSPVYTGDFVYGTWWENSASLKLVLSEYHKTIATLAYGYIR